MLGAEAMVDVVSAGVDVPDMNENWIFRRLLVAQVNEQSFNVIGGDFELEELEMVVCASHFVS